MNCSEIEQLIYLVREGELTEQEMIRVKEHLAGCEHCRQLSGSVKAMTDLTRRLVYENSRIDDSNHLIQVVSEAIQKKDRPHILPVMKSIAAAFLFILTSVYIYQEYSFSRNREALQVRLQQSAGQKEAMSEETVCVERLKRRIRTGAMASFSVPESRLYEKISEEELTQFIRQICESGGADAGTLQKLLMQAGLINLNTRDK